MNNNNQRMLPDYPTDRSNVRRSAVHWIPLAEFLSKSSIGSSNIKKPATQQPDAPIMSHTTLKLLSALLTICLCGLTACNGSRDDTKPSSSKTEVSSDSVAPHSDEQLAAAIDLAAESAMAAEHLPGAAVVVVRNGVTIFKKGYGFANVDSGAKVDPDVTLFRIGSVTKALTSLAVTSLADSGKIDLQDNVARYFEGFDQIPNTSGSTEPVKLWNLITHTGGFDQIGIGRHVWQLDKTLAERKALRPNLQTFLADGNLRRTSAPGEHFRYDTYGITLAGAVLENVTGKLYPDAMKAILFEPLGMTRSFVEVPEDLSGDLAVGYGYENGKYLPSPYEVYVTTPASSIDATPADMGRLLEALTSDGSNKQGRLFGNKTAQAVLAPQFRPHPEFPGITHGLFEDFSAEKGHAVRSAWHGGSMLGYLSSFTLLPELNMGYFIVTNRDPEAGGGNVSIHGQVGKAILDTVQENKTEPAPHIPVLDRSVDVSTYEGDYVYSVYCQTCTQAEFERGGWQRGRIVKVTAVSDGLKIGDQVYLADENSGLFVRNDGQKKVYFGRNRDKEVTSFSYNSSPDVFERIGD